MKLPSIIIREAQSPDRQRLIAMREKFFDSQIACGMSSPPRDVRAYSEHDSTAVLSSRFVLIHVAECTDPPIGVCGYALGRIKTMSSDFTEPCIGYLQELYVEPEQRRNHCGDLLLRSISQAFLSKGSTRLEVQVLLTNNAALKFWQQHGFQERVVLMDTPLARERS